ncbi:MAG: class I SAM-dependent methyltransferase [Polyangiaceae bacterium]
MKTGQPSQTASMVALLRAFGDAGISHVADFSDPTARKLLPSAWAKRLARAEARMKRGPSTMLEAARHGADMMALRTLVIDEAIRQAVTRGARQLVILGAGLDGRAFRLRELERVAVFENDHPATQSFKKERASALVRAAQSVTFVSIDFEKETLEERLASSGFRMDLPTAWVWEGVTMYLTHEATRATLRSLARAALGEATLIVNYHTTRRSLLTNLLLRLWSEPQIGEWSTEAIAAELRAVGFDVESDTSAADWAARYGIGLPRYGLRDAVRIVVARRPSVIV